MKKIYIVRGSEDGNIGAYSNIKRAFARAMDYMNQNGLVKTTVMFMQDTNPPTGKEAPASYANVCKKLTDIGLVTIESNDRASVEIELFYLNQ